MSDMYLKICGICVISVSCITIFKQLEKDRSTIIRLASVIVLSLAILTLSIPVIDYIKGIMPDSSVSEYVSVILKALGIAFLSSVCSSVCKDCGENTLSCYAELAGKIEIILLSLPIIKDIMDMALGLIDNAF